MNVVCYGQPQGQAFGDVLARLQKTHPEFGLELHQSLDSFVSRLRQPGRNIALVLLYIADRMALSDLLGVRRLLNDLPVVILLNGEESDLIQRSHELRPRVILYPCWEPEEICSVIQRCIDKSCGRDAMQGLTARSKESTEDHGRGRNRQTDNA